MDAPQTTLICKNVDVLPSVSARIGVTNTYHNPSSVFQENFVSHLGIFC